MSKIKMLTKYVGKGVANYTADKAKRTIITPIDQMIDASLTDISSTLGSFIIRSVRGKFQRSITFTVGQYYNDEWMEAALYEILYKYNDIRNSSNLVMTGGERSRGETNYAKLSRNQYRLADGTHNLKFQNYDILLVIQTTSSSSMSGKINSSRIYTIITYNLSTAFVNAFEREMIANRNAIMKINPMSPMISVYKDGHEGDGYTYWTPLPSIAKRKMSTIYIPNDIKRQLVDTINKFFINRRWYRKHGISHNLKILLYGKPGGGKDSLARAIASEWNRQIFYVSGGKNGRFIPDALSTQYEFMSNPLFLVSDIDKYPIVVNESDIDTSDSNVSEDKISYRQVFANMINVLDGVLSGEDKIIIMTTNHIEKISEVLLRPGRVDIALEIPYPNEDVFRKYVWDMYKFELPKDIKLKDYNRSIAEMQADAVFMDMPLKDFIAKYVE